MNPIKKIIKRCAPHSYALMQTYWAILKSDTSQLMYARTCTIAEDIEEFCAIFVSEDKRNDAQYMKRLKRDIIRCYYLYGTNTNEYFLHEFEKKTRIERSTYLSKKQKDAYCAESMNGYGCILQLKDKWNFYQMARPYFRRDVMLIDKSTPIEEIKAFYSKYLRVFVKPLSGACGKGCFVSEMSAKSGGGALPHQFASDRWMIEELIDQDDRIAKWNESSVNTIRMPSFRDANGNIEITFPLIRTGRKGCVVDNAGSGGVFASVDEKTGVVCTDGYDESGHIFVEHPDSHIVFKGYQIPQWKELIELVKEIHKSMPVEHKYIGFDMALSKKGWVLVEGNWGEFVMQQRALGRGIRNDFETLLKKC